MEAIIKRCACPRRDAYDCWAYRYNPRMMFPLSYQDMQNVEYDGGPCACSCHEDEDEDDGA